MGSFWASCFVEYRPTQRIPAPIGHYIREMKQNSDKVCFVVLTRPSGLRPMAPFGALQQLSILLGTPAAPLLEEKKNAVARRRLTERLP